MTAPEFKNDLDKLNPIRIQFQNAEDDRSGFATLIVSGMPVHALRDNKYIVNLVQVKMLDEKHIPYVRLD